MQRHVENETQIVHDPEVNLLMTFIAFERTVNKQTGSRDLTILTSTLVAVKEAQRGTLVQNVVLVQVTDDELIDHAQHVRTDAPPCGTTLDAGREFLVLNHSLETSADQSP